MQPNLGNTTTLPPQQIQQAKELMRKMNSPGVNQQTILSQICDSNPQFATIMNMINLKNGNWEQQAKMIAEMLYAQRGIDLNATIQQLQS